jgi:hypothetical protein
MTAHELAQFRPVSGEEIEAALREGMDERIAAERVSAQAPISSSLLFR